MIEQDGPICSYCETKDAEFVIDKQPTLIARFRDVHFRLYRCRHCGLFYTWPRTKEFCAAVSRYFVERWDSKDRILVPAQEARAIWSVPTWRKIIMPILRRAKRAVYSAVGKPPDVAASRNGEALRLLWRRQRFSLLDVGCSYGSFVKTARLNGIEAFGLDPNEELVAVIRDLGVPFIHQGVFPERHGPLDRYDVLTFISVIDYFPELTRDFFLECRRLLNPSGSLLICEIDPESSLARKNRVLEVPVTFIFTSKTFMQRAADDAGFSSYRSVPCLSEPMYIFHIFEK